MKKFMLGDVVHLNSNPEVKMTIFNIQGNTIAVKYFSRMNKLEIKTFSSETLTLEKKC
ncbi:hypothetical protein [Flavobacterium ginsengiterrae]|uniref:Uncharacterized protein n=1 Tax=Flavobacterium ginsengiterrae TaxID=871695 RepID=A0ABP7GXK2_9FLAO